MSLSYRVYRGAQIAPVIDTLAALRIAVFRDWPYLYDGDLDYERAYLASYAGGASILVAAFVGSQMVGASTGLSFTEHAAELSTGLSTTDIPPSETFYCAESVLIQSFRGQGAGRVFFAEREAHARTRGFTYATFCAVSRPSSHPARPPHYRPLDPFWKSLGYAPFAGATASLSWRDIGEAAETSKPMQFWIKRL
ncbi:GNAT family N-acetyltransferase [Gymnodinialimonas sp.]